MPAKLEIYLIGALLLVACVTGAYFYAKHQGVIEERARWELKQAAATKADLQELIDAQAYSNTLVTETKDAIGKIRIVNITKTGAIEREIKTDVRYVNDCFPDTGRLQWNAISAGAGVLPDRGTGQQLDGRGAQLPQAIQSASPQLPSGNAITQPRSQP